MRHFRDEGRSHSNPSEPEAFPFTPAGPFAHGHGHGRGRHAGRGDFGPDGRGAHFGPGGGRGGRGGGRGVGPGGFGGGGEGPGGGRGGPFGFGGGGAGGFGWNPFRRGPRAKRGDIRAAILALLKEEPRNGYQIMQELKKRSEGMWNPSPGSVYPALQQLEDERLIATEEGAGGRVYALTDEGKAYVKEHAEDVTAPWEALTNAAGDEFMEVMSLFRQVGAAVMQVVQAGDTAQVGKAKKVLVATRRSLYEILAEGSPEDE